MVSLLILISSSSAFSKTDNRPALYKKHFACVSPYLSEIRDETNFKKKKNKKILNNIIDGLPSNFNKVYSKGRVKHYMKQARSLSQRSSEVFKEQIRLNHKNVNITLLVPEYCFENLKNSNSGLINYNIEDFLKDKNFKYEGLQESFESALSDVMMTLNTFWKKTINSTSYRDFIKKQSFLLYPLEYMKCFNESDFSKGGFKTKFNEASMNLKAAYNEKDFKELISQNEKFLKFSQEQILLQTKSPFYVKGKSYLQVPADHDYYQYKSNKAATTKKNVETLNSAMDEFYNLRLVTIFHTTKKNYNSKKFEFMKEQSLCTLKAKYFKNNAIVDGYITSGKANELLRSL